MLCPIKRDDRLSRPGDLVMAAEQRLGIGVVAAPEWIGIGVASAAALRHERCELNPAHGRASSSRRGRRRALEVGISGLRGRRSVSGLLTPMSPGGCAQYRARWLETRLAITPPAATTRGHACVGAPWRAHGCSPCPAEAR